MRSKSPKGFGMGQNGNDKIFQTSPSLWNSAQIYCQWLRCCCRHPFTPYSASGAAFPTACSRFDTSWRAPRPPGCTHPPGPGAGTLSSPREGKPFTSQPGPFFGQDWIYDGDHMAASRRGTQFLNQNKLIPHTPTLRAFPATQTNSKQGIKGI